MPAGLIEEQDCVCSGADLNRDLIEMEACMASLLQAGSTSAAPVPSSGQTAPNR